MDRLKNLLMTQVQTQVDLKTSRTEDAVLGHFVWQITLQFSPEILFSPVNYIGEENV